MECLNFEQHSLLKVYNDKFIPSFFGAVRGQDSGHPYQKAMVAVKSLFDMKFYFVNLSKVI